MKKIVTAIIVILFFKYSLIDIYAEVMTNDYGLKKIGIGNRVIVGVNDGLIVYAENNKFNNYGMQYNSIRFYGMQDISGKYDNGEIL